MRNRSVPSDSVVPHICYQDPVGACAWLTKVFGFRENFRYGDPVSGVQVLFGQVCLMLHRANPGCLSPAQLGYGTQNLTLIVDDVDAHYAKTVAEGATIVEELHETIYGNGNMVWRTLRGTDGSSRSTRGMRTRRDGAQRCSRVTEGGTISNLAFQNQYETPLQKLA
ncbi:MAG: VOC family protein [Terracidiphilus sp.]